MIELLEKELKRETYSKETNRETAQGSLHQKLEILQYSQFKL